MCNILMPRLSVKKSDQVLTLCLTLAASINLCMRSTFFAVFVGDFICVCEAWYSWKESNVKGKDSRFGAPPMFVSFLP